MAQFEKNSEDLPTAPSEVKAKARDFFVPRNQLKKPLSHWQLRLAFGGIFIIAAIFIIGSYFINSEVADLSDSPVSVSEPEFVLSLESPVDQAVVLGNEVVVEGKTLPNALVVFYTETDEGSVEADNQGEFEGKIPLESGLNTLVVTAFGPNGEEKSLSIDLVYDDQGPVLGKKASKTPPGQVKKEENASSEVLIGNVGEVTEDSVMITGKNNAETRTKVDKETKIIGQNKKNLRLDSLGPDDVAAIITAEDEEATQSNQLRKAVRIYVRQNEQVRQTKRRAVHGVIVEIEGETLTLAHQIHRERTYFLMATSETVIIIKGVAGASFADLGLGQRVAAVGSLNEEGVLVAKRIHVIPGEAVGILEKSPFEPLKEASPSPVATFSPSLSPEPTITETPTVYPTQ